MDFNIAFMGPEGLYHLRRDFILALKYGLEDLGHRVGVGGQRLDPDRFNLVIGAYFLPSEKILAMARSGLRIAHVNTEVIADDMLNYNPDKVDFLGAYLPAMQAGQFVWDVIMDNMAEHERYGSRAHYLRWGWHPKLEDIQHAPDKDLDFYFFGMLSGRRREILNALAARGLRGYADHTCPYFQRNDFIARAKVQLNIVQEEIYSHVNSFRICYLANNRCAIVSERENDPAGYLDPVRIASKDNLPEVVEELVRGDGWRDLGNAIYEDFRAKPGMKESMEALLERSLASANTGPQRGQGAIPPKPWSTATAGETIAQAKVPEQPPRRAEATDAAPGFGLLRSVLKEVFRSRRPAPTHAIAIPKPPQAESPAFTYAQDGLYTVHNSDFTRDPRFMEAYRFGIQGGRPNIKVQWRVHVALWLAEQAIRLEGDFVEFGVHTGILSGAIMTQLDFARHSNRHYYLLDTFAGIPEEQISADERSVGVHTMNRKYADGDRVYEMIQDKFAPWPNARIIRGRVPDTLGQVESEKVAFVSMDMNVAEAEIAAAEFIWPKMVPGAFMLLDDYGWQSHVNQKNAFDIFAARHQIDILYLPTGQGVLTKPNE